MDTPKINSHYLILVGRSISLLLKDISSSLFGIYWEVHKLKIYQNNKELYRTITYKSDNSNSSSKFAISVATHDL